MLDIWLGEIGAFTTLAKNPKQMQPRAMKENERNTRLFEENSCRKTQRTE